MLCTPPAFILSQDQTLENFISYLPLGSYNLFSSYSFLASFTLLSIYNSIDEICISHFAMLCTISFVVQFSMIVLCPLSRTAWILYHNTFPLSIPFLNFFSKSFFKASLWTVAPLSRRPAYYISFSSLCQGGYLKKSIFHYFHRKPSFCWLSFIYMVQLSIRKSIPFFHGGRSWKSSQRSSYQHLYFHLSVYYVYPRAMTNALMNICQKR